MSARRFRAVSGMEKLVCGEREREREWVSEWESESADLSVAITDWNERGGDGSPITRIPLLLLENTENKQFVEISPSILTAHGKRDTTGICFGIASAEFKGNSWNASSYLWCLELGATMLGRGMYTEYVTFQHAFCSLLYRIWFNVWFISTSRR